jgi:hypothetical protein
MSEPTQHAVIRQARSCPTSLTGKSQSSTSYSLARRAQTPASAVVFLCYRHLLEPLPKSFLSFLTWERHTIC